MKCYAAIVIGLGGMGSAATSHLATRGVKTLGLEQFDPLHTRGSSHGESRVIRQSYFEHPNYVPLLLRAYELWTQLQSESGLDLMTITGGLMIGRPDSQTIVGSQQSALQHHLRHEMLTAKQIQERFPVLTPTSELVGLYEQNAGFVRPERCIQAHLARAEAAGADLHFGERLIDWTPSSKNSTALVRTTRDTYETSSLVLAPGAWAPKLFKLDVSLQAVRQILFWIEPLCDPEAFAPERFPIYIWECDGGVQFYGFPQHGPANAGIKVAIFYNDDPCDPDNVNPLIGDEFVQQIRSCLQRRIPCLSGRIVKAIPCMYTNTPDHHFVLGKHPRFPMVTIASPCSGHGFKFCSVIGEILADLATTGSTRHGIDMFSPTRETLTTPCSGLGY